MSKMNIRFRDPSTGQMHSVQGEVKQKITQDNPQSTDALRNDTKDGQVDVFLHMDNHYESYGRGTTRKSVHLQIDNEHLTPEQAQALAAAIRSGQDDAISIDNNSYNVLTIQTDLWNERSDLSGVERHDPKVSLSGDDKGVFLSQEGVFSTEPGAAGDIKDTAAALFRAAEATDQLAEGETIFSRNNVSLETKQAALTQIDDLLARAPAAGLSGNEAAQVRSSAATVLTDMISSLGNDGPDAALKEQAFGALHQLIEGETIGGLRESMIFNAIRVQPGLGNEARDIVSDLRAEIAPTAPPTDAWFADGKRELNVNVAAGHGEGFYEGATEWFGKQGFKVIEEGNDSHWNSKPREIQLKKTVNGEEFTVNIHIRNFDDDSFKEINNDNYDIVAYMGHSNLGANTRKSVDNAPDATGKDKLIFLGLCSGKDNIDRVREAFPEGQMVTTFNSSYFNTRPLPGGGKQFSQGEDIKALMQIINGSLEQSSWSEINDNIRDKAVGWNHKDSTVGNYVTPLDLQMGAKFRDIDNDGSAMVLDRHYNLDVLEVRPGPSGSFEARDNNVDGQKLNGELPHLAAAFANTIDLYNPTFDNFSHKGRILADGFYKGGADDPVVKFETRVENGEKAFVMQVNEAYAHIGEEALRAVTMVEYNNHLASTEESYPINDPVERELLGLLTAAASLSYDSGYRDAAVFEAMVDHYGLPEGLKWSDAGGLIDAEHHDYTGSVGMARKWLGKLDAGTKDALRAQLADR